MGNRRIELIWSTLRCNDLRDKFTIARVWIARKKE